MSGDEVLEFVRETTGIWWPAADEEKLRQAAAAYRAMAKAIEEATGTATPAARSIAANNSGTAIERFDQFWDRYDAGAQRGWLPDAAEGCRQVAAGFEKYAKAVEDAKAQVILELEVLGTVVVVGTALAIFTAGASEAAAAAVGAAAIAAAEAIGVALSATVAEILGVIAVATCFGALESIVLDLAVVQPMHMSLGDQKELDWGEVGAWALGGAVGGAVAGGLTSALRGGAQLAADAGHAKLASSLDGIPAGLAGQTVLGGLGNVGTTLATGGDATLADLLSGAAGGAAGAGATRALRRNDDRLGILKALSGDAPDPLWNGPLDPIEQRLLKSLEEVSSHSPFKPGDHINQTDFVACEDGASFIYKPISGEQPIPLDEGPTPRLEFDPKVRDVTFPPGTSAGREVAVSRLDRELGFDLVPPTTPWDGYNGKGSAQVFRIGSGSLPATEYPQVDQERMAVLDYISGSTDRHANNYMTTLDNRPIAIDHGYSFPDNMEVPMRSSFVTRHLNYPLDEEVLHRVRALAPERLEEILYSSGMSTPSIENAVARLREIQIHGKITGESWDGRIFDVGRKTGNRTTAREHLS